MWVSGSMLVLKGMYVEKGKTAGQEAFGQGTGEEGGVCILQICTVGAKR